MNIDDLQIGQNNISNGTPPLTPMPTAQKQFIPNQQMIQQTPMIPPQMPMPQAPVNVPIPQKTVDQDQMHADKELEKNLWTLRIEAVNPNEKKQKKTNWFFRTLMILTLLTIWALMLLDQLDIMKNISYNWIIFNQYFPYVIILWAFILFAHKRFVSKILWFLFFLAIVGGLTTVVTYHSLVIQPEVTTPSVYDFANVTENKLSFDTFIGSYDLKWKNSPTMDLRYYWDRKLFNSTWIENNIWFLTIKEDSNWNILQNYSSNIEVDLPSNSKFEINVTNIAGYKDLNLENISWNKINLKWWRWDNILRIWKNINPEAEITIDNLVWIVVFKIPETVWVDLYYKGLYSNMEMIDMEAKDKWHYQSKNYATATQKIKVTVNMWIGTLKVDWMK